MWATLFEEKERETRIGEDIVLVIVLPPMASMPPPRTSGIGFYDLLFISKPLDTEFRVNVLPNHYVGLIV